jgi:hypothetical protein
MGQNQENNIILESLREIKDYLIAFCNGVLSLEELLDWTRRHPFLWKGKELEKDLIEIHATREQVQLLDQAFFTIILLDPTEPERYRSNINEIYKILSYLKGEEPYHGEYFTL